MNKDIQNKIEDLKTTYRIYKHLLQTTDNPKKKSQYQQKLIQVKDKIKKLLLTNSNGE